MCCSIFVFFIFGMIIISGIGLSQGEPSRIFTPFDSDGNQCGVEDQMASKATIKEIRDMTEYKYKYFTNLGAIKLDAPSKDMFKDPVIYWAVCVKECPDGVTVEKIATKEKIDCMINNDVTVCPSYSDSIFMNTTTQYNYCIPRTDKAEAIIKEMYKELNDSIGGFGNYINDINDAWFVMLIMAIVSFLVTIAYVWLLKYVTKPLLYSSLVLIFFLGCGTGFYAYSQTMAM